MKTLAAIGAWALTISVLAAVPARSAEVTQPELLQAATDLGHRYDTNYAARDAAAMAMLYAPDGILVSPSGPIIRGRDALKAYYTARFASGARDHAIKVLEVHVQGDGGYALDHFSVTVPVASGAANGATRQESGSIVTVIRRDATGWHLGLVEPSVPPAEGK